jgi:2-succinyl-5-enolpyruvyl-6-hydroxy-3-cyclohexene-1-carboxylate synthase
VLADELVRAGLRHVVVCPGSRNAPLSMAVHRLALDGRVTLHVRIDERSAGFLALGLARGLGSTGFAGVLCTSGTAVANLHPAALEAHHSGIALLLLTADRPTELYGTGANQTIAQHGLFGPTAPCVQLPVAQRRAGAVAVWRATVDRAVALAEAGGPVQLNIPFAEPLVPDTDPDWPESLAGRPDGQPWTRRRSGHVTAAGPVTELTARTVVIVGDDRPDRIAAVTRIATAAGWPVIAEPTGAPAVLAAGGPLLSCGSLLLNAGELAEELRPDSAIVVGRPTLTRGVGRVLRSAGVVYAVGEYPQWTDPQHVVALATPWLAQSDVRLPAPDPDWLPAWRRADQAARTAVDKTLAGQTEPAGQQIAAELVDALPEGAVLFLGSSNPVRFVDQAARPRADLLVVANRGVAGIDGSVSTAAGLALGSGRATYALLGDLTFLHDVNGLLIGPTEARPDLTVVVLNDDGGGIFSVLEQGAPEHAAGFERVFGTPHGADLAALCAGYRVPHVLAGDLTELRAALRPAPGLRVVEVRTVRAEVRERDAGLRAAVATAVRTD